MNCDSSNPSFGRLDLWYGQLYCWLSAGESSREDVTKGIVKNCEANLVNLANVVEGRFIEDTVVDKKLYIRFSDLTFKMNLMGNIIDCAARIRINPCIKVPLFIFRSAYAKSTKLEESDVAGLKTKAKDYSIYLSSTPSITERGNSVWLMSDSGSEYLIRKLGQDIEFYSRANAPYYSKVWIIISSTNSFDTKLKDLFFKEAARLSKKLCDETANLYLDKFGGANKIGESCTRDSLQNIKIISVATDDERISYLLGKKEDHNELSKLLNSTDDASKNLRVYLNNVLNVILTGLCGTEIEDWKGQISNDQLNECAKNSSWKVVKSGDIGGLYGWTKMDKTSITSAAFLTKDKNYDAVNNLLRTWGQDLNIML